MKNFFTLLATGGTFILVSSPSIKVFYSSQLINIFAIVILLFVFIQHIGEIFKEKYNRNGFSIYLISLLIFFIYYLFGVNSQVGYENIFRYFYLLTSLFLVSALASYINVKLFIWFIIGWGALISLLKLTDLLRYDSELGQTYLTVGLPMGAGLSSSIALLFYSKAKFFSPQRIPLLFSIIIIISALLISRGRSNILYPGIVLVVTMLCNIFFNHTARIKYLIIIGFTVIVVGGYIANVLQNSEYQSVNRLTESMDNVEEEERYVKWATCIELISKRPFFGYGVDSCYELLGNYPHNIFFEVTLSYGMPILIIFLFFIFSYLRSFVKLFKETPTNGMLVSLGSVALYFFFSWNTSFDLATAYIPLATIILFLTKTRSYG